MNEDNKYKLKDYMLNRPPLTPERIKELEDLTCYMGDLAGEELKSPVVLRSEYESLREFTRHNIQFLASHDDLPQGLKAYCNRVLQFLELDFDS